MHTHRLAEGNPRVKSWYCVLYFSSEIWFVCCTVNFFAVQLKYLCFDTLNCLNFKLSELLEIFSTVRSNASHSHPCDIAKKIDSLSKEARQTTKHREDKMQVTRQSNRAFTTRFKFNKYLLPLRYAGLKLKQYYTPLNNNTHLSPGSASVSQLTKLCSMAHAWFK